MKNRIFMLAAIVFAASNVIGQSLEDGDLNEGLVGYISFDKVDGNTLTVDKGTAASNQGTIQGATFSSDSLNAKYGSAAIFGGDDYIVLDIQNSGPFVLKGKTELSIAAWVRPTKADKTWQRIVSLSRAYYLELSDDNNFASFVSLQRPNGDYSNAFSRAVLNTVKGRDEGKWMHVAFAFNGSESVMYINGKEVDRRDAKFNDGSLVKFDNKLYIGAGYDEGERPFNGNIDEVYVYNRVLTSEEVTKLMNMQNP